MTTRAGGVNPFDDDDDAWMRRRADKLEDDDDEEEFEAPRTRQEELRQEVLRRQRAMAQSTGRSAGLIADSEKVGVETAQELIRQGEALRRTEKTLDKMDGDLTISQRHISSIKSVFGGLANYFRSKPEPPKAEPPVEDTARGNARLQEALDKSKETQSQYEDCHPVLRKQEMADIGSETMPGGAAKVDGSKKNPVLQAYHQKMDNDLEDIGMGLGRLKGLALGLQMEIGEQDEVIDRLTSRVDKVDTRVRSTNQQVRKL
uniref:Synaptosomal-associated protein 29 n=1 Tax=Petromyzon marinus TaxID=7757 RepID=S4RUR1_PETMA